MDYFEARKMDLEKFNDYQSPKYFENLIAKDDKILDFGCGFGQVLRSLGRKGYKNLFAVDILPNEKLFQNSGIIFKKITNFDEILDENFSKFDVVMANHVIEHLPKELIIPFLSYCREKLLTEKGKIIISVPNAQSVTGAYWAYEDFTHTTMFTSGSLYYVFKMAGYKGMDFIDMDCSAESKPLVKVIRKIFFRFYKAYLFVLNKLSGSAFHYESPTILSFEIKAVAYK